MFIGLEESEYIGGSGMRRAHVTGQDGSYLAELVRVMVDIDVGLFDSEPSGRTVRVDR
jgi:hypothetical protein